MVKKLGKYIVGASLIIGLALVGIENAANFLSLLLKGLAPVFAGIITALLLARPYEYFRARFTLAIKNVKIKKWAKVMALAVTYLIFISLAALFFVFVAPQLVKSIEIFYSNADSYLITIRKAADDVINALPFETPGFEITEESIAKLLFGGDLPVTKLIEGFMGAMREIAGVVVNAGVGIVLSVYLLASGERLKNELTAFTKAYMKRQTGKNVMMFVSTVYDTFSIYLAAQLTEALILFCMCYVGMLIFGFEYPLVVSAIIGITNMIPLVGPFIGALPGVIICLLATPSKTIWFVVFVVVIQQLENNIIAPKLVGDSVGLPPVWVFLSLVLAGAFLGIGAMFICVPSFSVIYKLIKYKASERTAD